MEKEFKLIPSLLNSIKPKYLKADNPPQTGYIAVDNGEGGFHWVAPGTEEFVDIKDIKISANDNAPNYLENKLTAEDGNILITVCNEGLNEGLHVNVGSNIFQMDNNTTNDIIETVDKVFVTPAEKTAITHDNRSNLDSINQDLATTSDVAFSSVKVDTEILTIPTEIGTFYWDASAGTASLRVKSDVSLQLGQENHVYGRNNTGSTILNGKVVYISGALGNKATIALANNSNSTADKTIGITTEDVLNNENGLVTTFGLVRDIDTSAYIEGDLLYLSDTNGEFTNVVPTAPKTTVSLGVVLYAHNSNGIIFVNSNIVPKLSELSDVSSDVIPDGGHLYWDNASSTFKPLEGGFNSKSLWEDIIVPPSSLGTGASAPDLVALTGNILAYGFDGSVTTEQLYGSFELPHNYKEGTTLRPHIHFASSNTAIGNVKFNLEYTYATKDASFSTPVTLTAIEPTTGVTAMHKIVEFGVIANPAFTIGTIFYFRLYRNPTDVQDTYTSDALLLSLGVHYEVDSDGSRQIFVK